MKNFLRKKIKTITTPCTLSRKQKILYNIDILKTIGLEIGGSYNPIIKKSECYIIETLDHASQTELKIKYKDDPNVNINMIEHVDYIWNGEKYSDIIKKTNYYDYIIASHVVEHTTDLIAFLLDCQELLTNDGILSLAIPDKRYCFDHLRPHSSIGDIIQAFLEKKTKHSIGKIFDNKIYASQKNGVYAWSSEIEGKLDLINKDSLMNIYSNIKKNINYEDTHNWCFTPSSFELVIRVLSELNIIKFGIHKQFETTGCEFFFQLKKQSSNSLNSNQLLQLMKNTVSEV